MQRGNGGRDDFFGGFGGPFGGFGSPFAGFGGPFGGFGGFGGPGSMIPSVFGGSDPFADPFFTQPFGFGGLMGPSMLGPSMFGAGGSLFGERSNAGFLEQQAAPSEPRGPIIQELSSDDDEEGGDTPTKEKEGNCRKHSRPSKEPYVEDPDEETKEKKVKNIEIEYRDDFNKVNTVVEPQPQARAYSFRSSAVTYGGLNGAYYTSSATKRMGGDGVTVEEVKEADATTGKATHRLSRGIRDKGHSLTRKLSADGRVDAMQTLHNLNEDELTGFEEAWKGNARQHMPGWDQGLDFLDNGNNRSGRRDEPPASAGGWALPAPEQPRTRPQYPF